MNEIMNVIHFERKEKMLDTLEKFYIYRETKNGNQINDRLTVQSNPIFETILRQSSERGQHPLKAVETPTHVTHRDSTPEQLPKSLHSDHNTVDKNSTEQNIEQCQHPTEGTHIHTVEQFRPQGMKKEKQRTKQRNTCKSF